MVTRVNTVSLSGGVTFVLDLQSLPPCVYLAALVLRARVRGGFQVTIGKLLIANRGEIAVRIQRTAHEMGITTVSVFPDDDKNALHALTSDTPVQLEGTGAAAYLDIEQIIDIAKQNNCDAVHPGYGFLAENHRFARACHDANIVFVGPHPDTLELFGDKLRARE